MRTPVSTFTIMSVRELSIKSLDHATASIAPCSSATATLGILYILRMLSSDPSEKISDVLRDTTEPVLGMGFLLSFSYSSIF